MLPTAPDYDDLGRLLAVSELSPSAAEAHGCYCGLLAASAHLPESDPEDRWLAELLAPSDAPDQEDRSNLDHSHGNHTDSTPGRSDQAESLQQAVAECRARLQDLAARTRARINGPELGFELFLPADDRPLRERAVGVHEWTRGFLFGLGLAGVDAQRLAPQTREAFDDLLEVTRMDLNDLDDDEANEQALSDVSEFVRVAALLLYEDDMPTEHSR